jgi:uncharacterized membrane protein
MISYISKVETPLNKLIKGRNIRENIFNEILKEYPEFQLDDYITIDELDQYRKKYIKDILNDELSVNSNDDDDIINSIMDKTIISNNTSNAEKLTYGQRLADKVAIFGGSWNFIMFFGLFILLWISLNVILLMNKGFDAYPFVLLNLILGIITSMQAPIIMMSQNRQAEKDRKQSDNNYLTNIKSEIEVHLLHEKIDHIMLVQQEKQIENQEQQLDILNEIKDKLNC